MAGAQAVGTASWISLPEVLGGGVLDEGVVVEMNEVVVVVEVAEWEAEETNLRDGAGCRTAGVGVDCLVLWAMRVGLWVRAPGVCARSPWCPVRARAGAVGWRHVWCVVASWSCLGCEGWLVIEGVQPQLRNVLV